MRQLPGLIRFFDHKKAIRTGGSKRSRFSDTMTSNCLENSLRWVFETRSFLFQPLGIEETKRTFIVRCKLVPCELATWYSRLR